MGYVLNVHFVIMGYGRMGATLVKEVIAHRHSLVMIDNNPGSFRKLPKDFKGQKVTDEGYGRDTQCQTGIEDTYGFAAVAGGDNADILVTRVARETYGVKKVAAQIADSRRTEVYRRLEVPIVGMVDRIAQSLLSRVLPLDSGVTFTEDISKLVLCRVLSETSWVGHTVVEIQQMLGIRAAYVSRFSRVALVGGNTILQENDELYFSVTVPKHPAVASRLVRVFKED